MIEQNIIGMSLKGEIDPLSTGLLPEHFTNFALQEAWAMIVDVRIKKQIPDLITVYELLQKKNPTVDWFVLLAQMQKESLPKITADGHIKKIKQNWVDNEIAKIGKEMSTSSEKDLNLYIKKLMSLNVTEKNYLHSFTQAADDAFIEIEKVINGEIKTVKTGLIDVDQIMGGLHNSDLIIVAARPAMGKTAFLLNMAAANENSPLVFSTEQSRIQAAQRFFSIYGNVPNHKIRTGDLDDDDFAMLTTAVAKISQSNGWIYDKSGPYMSEIEATAREVYQNHGCTAIYLDYLQRIKHENTKLPKHEQVGDIAMRLKELARELNIPVVALAQVSRKCEDRADKRPQMGDIKDSGTIEQEADSILTLYRDDVYNDDSADNGTCEIDFKKNRHGGTGMIRVKWTAPTMKFENLAKGYY